MKAIKKTLTKFFVILVIIAGIMFFTNPRKARHKQEIVELVDQLIIDKIDSKITTKNFLGQIAKNATINFGSNQIEKLIDERLVVKNYILFSTTNIRIENQSMPIGIGIFGRVVLVL